MSNEVEIVIGPEIVKTWARLDYTVWYAIAEMVDNSLQAYFNNKKELDAVFDKEEDSLKVDITYDSNSGLLRVLDNSIGMNAAELTNALRVGIPPEYSGGLSEFGMGLKTSGVWLADEWKVRTKKLGEETELEISFSVDKIAKGNTKLPMVERKKDKSEHYTLIEFKSLRKKIHSNTLTKTKAYLSSIYRLQVRDSVLKLHWGDEPLIYDESLNILTASDTQQTPYKKTFDFKVNGKRAYGWCAVLKSGGRPKAGFAVFRRGRIIYGQPAAWRPSSLYGQETGSNDVVNQRLVGEIHLDDFVPSHTKNAILWQDDEEDLLNDKLFEQFADYRLKAKEGVRGQGQGPSDQSIDIAIDQLVETLTSKEFLDKVKFTDIPSKEVISAANAPIIENVQGVEPTTVIELDGNIKAKIYLRNEFSPNDPYFVKENPDPNTLIVILNLAHPFIKSNLVDSESLRTYMLMCCYDAIAEWKCEFLTHVIEPSTVKQVKDNYMRMEVKI
jgi:hypothetical protein